MTDCVANVADGFAFISKKFPPAKWNSIAFNGSRNKVRSNDIDTCFTFQMHQRRSRCFHCFNYGNLGSLIIIPAQTFSQHKMGKQLKILSENLIFVFTFQNRGGKSKSRHKYLNYYEFDFVNALRTLIQFQMNWSARGFTEEAADVHEESSFNRWNSQVEKLLIINPFELRY